MTKEKILSILESAKDKNGAIPMSLVRKAFEKLPPVQLYTNEEIQKIQELEQAEIQKAFQLGREDALSEIIRCKDCKHYEIWQLKSDYTDDKRFKSSVCVLGRYAVHRPEDWYCADAERRTDETDYRKE